MKNKYAKKELRLWTKEEDDILKTYWDRMPFPHSSHHGSKFKFLNKKLKEAGITDRTDKAISRRTFRIGLRSYIPTDTTIKTKCADCKKDIEVKERYYVRGKKNRCEDCQKIRNRKWDRDNREKKILYGREYRKK